MCGYSQGHFTGTTVWQRRDAPFGPPLSRHTDVVPGAHTGGYMGVVLERGDNLVAILESPTFNISRMSYVRMDIYSATFGARIRMCFDTYRDADEMKLVARSARRTMKTLRHCRDVFTEVNRQTYQRWNNFSVLMIPGFQKVSMQ